MEETAMDKFMITLIVSKESGNILTRWRKSELYSIKRKETDGTYQLQFLIEYENCKEQALREIYKKACEKFKEFEILDSKFDSKKPTKEFYTEQFANYLNGELEYKNIPEGMKFVKRDKIVHCVVNKNTDTKQFCKAMEKHSIMKVKVEIPRYEAELITNNPHIKNGIQQKIRIDGNTRKITLQMKEKSEGVWMDLQERYLLFLQYVAVVKIIDFKFNEEEEYVEFRFKELPTFLRIKYDDSLSRNNCYHVIRETRSTTEFFIPIGCKIEKDKNGEIHFWINKTKENNTFITLLQEEETKPKVTKKEKVSSSKINIKVRKELIEWIKVLNQFTLNDLVQVCGNKVTKTQITQMLSELIDIDYIKYRWVKTKTGEEKKYQYKG